MIKALNTCNQNTFRIEQLRVQLSNHKLYGAIDNDERLKIFMQYHVYAVWDFMSLIKALQNLIAPVTIPWITPKNTRFANFINQLVLEEESDSALTTVSNQTHASHFESYLLAMNEIGADIQTIKTFVNKVESQGLETALQMQNIPPSAKQFMQFTFDVIAQNEPHILTAVLAYGREDLVPQMFCSLENNLHISPEKAPNLFAYLQRHIQLDGDEHGPLAIQLLNELCNESEPLHATAVMAAEKALEVRLAFWDGIHYAVLH